MPRLRKFSNAVGTIEEECSEASGVSSIAANAVSKLRAISHDLQRPIVERVSKGESAGSSIEAER
jgi:hypothetical protein